MVVEEEVDEQEDEKEDKEEEEEAEEGAKMKTIYNVKRDEGKMCVGIQLSTVLMLLHGEQGAGKFGHSGVMLFRTRVIVISG